MNKKIAFFDVDKTLIRGDSMFKLVLFGIKKRHRLILGFPNLFIKLLLYRLKLLNVKKAKEAMFYSLAHLTEEELREFFYNNLLANIYKDALKEIVTMKEKEYLIILVSASPEIYLKYFEELDYVDYVIGTTMEINHTINRYLIKGENCKGEEKVRRIERFLKENNFEIDRKESFCYSDSLSDEPMFNLVSNKYLVNHKKGKEGYAILKWK